MKNKIKKLLAEYDRIPVPVKASLWFTVCNFLQKGISMITVPVFTRLLTTEQYGVYTVYQSWYSIITVFATLNLYYGVFNNGMVKYPDDRDRFTSSMQGLTTTITSAWFIVYLAASNFWNSVLGLPTILVLAMFAELIFMPAYSFWAARQRFEFRYRNLVIVTSIMTISSPVIGIAAVLVSEHKAEARVLSFVLVQVCIGGFFYIRNLLKGRTFFYKAYWRFGLGFNIPLIPHYLSQSVLNQSDRLMIKKMVGYGKSAIYSVAYSVAMLMILITSAINNSFIPYTYGCLKEEKYDDLKKNANALIILVGLGTFFVVAFGPEVIRIFAPEEYYEAIWVIPPVSASVYFIFLYPIFANVEFYYEENKFVMFASIGGAVSNIILNYIFIQIFGYIAAGYTTLACYMLFSGGHYFFMRKVLKKHNIQEKLYDSRFILMFSGLELLAMGIMMISYNYPIMRYGIIACMAAGVIVKRKAIIEVIKNIRKKR